MGTISGLATTYNAPNYHGELFAITPTDTPLLSAAGGLSGGGRVKSTVFEWQTEDLRDADVRARVEGADAPTSEERSRSSVDNVLQIFQEAVTTSYTKQGTTSQYTTPSSAPYITADGEVNPIQDEHAHQIGNALKTIARDVNYSFWYGKKDKPTSNSSARKTGGLLTVCTTNRLATGEITGASASTDTITVTHALDNGDKIVFTDVGASTAIRPDRVYYVVNKSTTVSFKVSETLGGSAITIGTATVSFIEAATTLDVPTFEAFMQGVYENGGISEQETAMLFTSPRQKRAITAAYADAYGKADLFAGNRNVGGVNAQVLQTNYGTLNVVIDRQLPPDAIALVSAEQLMPVFLDIPDKGVLFYEELARTGASLKSQIYGEIGLKYGNQRAHGQIRGLAV